MTGLGMVLAPRRRSSTAKQPRPTLTPYACQRSALSGYCLRPLVDVSQRRKETIAVRSIPGWHQSRRRDLAGPRENSGKLRPHSRRDSKAVDRRTRHQRCRRRGGHVVPENRKRSYRCSTSSAARPVTAYVDLVEIAGADRGFSTGEDNWPRVGLGNWCPGKPLPTREHGRRYAAIELDIRRDVTVGRGDQQVTQSRSIRRSG
jgi:hypothetical protein